MTDQELKDLANANIIAIDKMRDSIRELRTSQEKTDAQMQKTDEQIKNLGKRFWEFGNSRGQEVEDFFYRYFHRNRRLPGVEFDRVERNMITTDGQEHDIILINGQSSALISVKHKLHKKDIDSIVNDEMPRMKYFLRGVGSTHRLYGWVASFVVSDAVQRYAQEQGLYVLTRSGENTLVLNDADFQAQEF